MSIIRRLARPLLAASFIQSGLDALRHPEPRVDSARPLVAKVAGPLRLPEDPELFVRTTGGIVAGAGTLLAIGRLPRASALVLVAALAPGAVTEHAFWQERDPEARRAQRLLFLRDLGLLGGALLAAVDTDGRPGLAWRGRHAGSAAAGRARRAGKRARKQAHDLLPGD